MGKYKKMLMQQFLISSGINVNDCSPEFIKSEFNKWIIEMQRLGNIYLELLNERFQLDNNIAEVGKSLHDSVVLSSNVDLITPYIDSKDYGDRLIRAPFAVDGINPVFMTNGVKNNLYYNGFITQNPMSYEDVKYWNRLHLYNYFIAIGMYGKLSDNDFLTKQKMLSQLIKRIFDNYEYWFTVIDDNYFMGINTTRTRKK